MEKVIMIYTDKSMLPVTPEEARKLCADPKTNGRIIDALTDDKMLQRELRALLEGE